MNENGNYMERVRQKKIEKKIKMIEKDEKNKREK